MWLYVVALISYIIVGFTSKYFADHLFYMTPVLNNMYMIMVQSLILARQYSETQEAEQTLEEKNAILDRLNSMKNEFFQNMNHNLKTPLTVVSTDVLNATDLLDYGMNEDEMRQSLIHAQQEIMNMARIVDSAMKHSAMQDNKQEIEPLDIASLLREGAETYRALLARNGNTLRLSIPDKPLHVLGNADTLLHVLSNLLSNANRHTRNGTINVTIMEERNAVTVTAQDDGEGVKPELLPYVWKRGVSDGGTGLGLPICKTAIEALGGSIYIESEQGKGTMVSFTLPGIGER
jgi:signal transduction histidine kinase